MADGRLEIAFQQCLGKGGFGEVYLATVTRPGGLSRQMAVKVLREGLNDHNDAVMRLRDEGRMLALLDHPCILRAHEMVRVQGRLALLTEYVEGIDLAKFCKPDRLLPPRVVVGALGEVAAALNVAFTTLSPETGRPLQLIHRDIKPENIRVTVHGQVKLLDFGIARSTEMVRHAQTKMGELPFTPGYAAPESFRRGEQGPEADVYALGVTMYRLLVGERLFEGMDIGVQFAVASLAEHYEPWIQERLSLLNADRRLIALVTRMLGYEKESRPTADMVRGICEDLADDLPGPTIQKWSRTFTFPPVKEVKGAVLVGKTLKEDLVSGTMIADAVPKGVSTQAPPARPPAKAPAARAPTEPRPAPDARAPESRSNPDKTPSGKTPSMPPQPPPGVKTLAPPPSPRQTGESKAATPTAATRRMTGPTQRVPPQPVPIPAPPEPPPSVAQQGLHPTVVVVILGVSLMVMVVAVAIAIIVVWGVT